MFGSPTTVYFDFPHSSLLTLVCSRSFSVDQIAVYNPAGYRGIPCLVLVVDSEVVYVGSPEDGFRETLEKALELLATETEREE